MKSTKSSDPRLSDSVCEAIAELYFLCDRNPRKISEKIQPPLTVTAKDLQHPKVRKLIEVKVIEGSKIMTRDDHIANLHMIRDKALEDETLNLKVALESEIAAGNAAGLYDKLAPPEQQTLPNPETMSTQQLRDALSKNVSLPAPTNQKEAVFVEVEPES